MLGEGEVSIQVDGARSYRIQESVFTGLWRVCEFDGDGRRVGDWLEAGDAAARSRSKRARAARERVAAAGRRCRAGAMNSPALLHEIAAQMRGAHARRARARHQPDAVPDDAGRPRGARAGAAGGAGGDDLARLRQLPHHLDAARATSGACSTSTT